MEQRELSLFLKPKFLKTRAEHGSEITRRFAMNPVGRMLAAGLQDRTIRLYDASNCEEMQVMQDEYLCTALAFSPRGDIVASGSVERVVKLWDIRTGEPFATFEGHTYPILSLSFSPDGDKLVSASGDTTLIIWDVDNHKLLTQMKGHTLYVKACDWDPSGNRIISGSVDSTICEWDPTTGKMTAKHNDHRTAVHTVMFTNNGETLASGSSDQTIIIWDGQSTPLKPERTLHGHSGEVRAVSFSTDGEYLASGSSDKNLFVWSTSDYTIQGESTTQSEVDGLEWYPDQHTFVTADGTGAIISWEVKDLKAMMTPFQNLLKEIEADTEQARRDEFVQKFETLRSQYDEGTLRDKRLFYVQWQCKKALGLLKGTPRKK